MTPFFNPNKSFVAICLFSLCLASFCKDIYVCGKTGNDKNPGTEKQPMKTPSKAVRKVAAGDTLIIREGRYHDSIGTNSIKDPEKPVTIRAAEGEKVVFDGTVAISEIAEGKWTLHKKMEKNSQRGIWKIKLKQDIWQLFNDGEIQTSARWPNAFWHDGSIWNQNHWASFGDNTMLKNKEYIDGDTKKFPHSDLSKAGFDAAGAMIIMNIANFDNYCEVVTEHGKGNERFKTTFNKEGTVRHMPIMRGPDRKNGKMTRQFRKGEGRLLPIFNLFYLECSLALLDAPTEWFYDKDSKTLYYYPMDGKDPTKHDVRGKVQTYAVTGMHTKGLILKGLDFFGTTFKFASLGRVKQMSHITIEDCNFMYPSYSKRMLKDRTPVEVSTMAWNQSRNFTDWWGKRHFTLRNCTFYRTDGVGIWMVGLGNKIENCLFKEIDYSAVDPASGRKFGKQMTFRGNDDSLQIRQSPDIQVYRVTVDTAGAAHTLTTGANVKGRHKVRGNRNTGFSKVSYCRVVRGGLLQVQDGANFHIWQFDSDYGTFDHCWASETTKWAFRFDGTYIPIPNGFDFNSRLDHCRVSYCVAWDTWQDKVFTGKNFTRYGSGNFILKGDHHYVYNNLSFDGGITEIYIRSEDKGNKNTATYNNLGAKISGKGRAKNPEPFNGEQGNNYGDKGNVNVRELLRDPDNLDFRPREGTPLVDKGKVIDGVTTDVVGSAPDIGPYEYGCKMYWIPGYQAPGASTPIPPNNSTTAKPDLDLMWLQGYKAKSHTVYFGTSKHKLQKVRTFSPDRNICSRSNPLTPGKTYYWRVDTVDRFGKRLKGDVWRFKVKAPETVTTRAPETEQK